MNKSYAMKKTSLAAATLAMLPALPALAETPNHRRQLWRRERQRPKRRLTYEPYEKSTGTKDGGRRIQRRASEDQGDGRNRQSHLGLG